MLKDSRSSALVENFGEQWLNLRLMDRTKPDAAKFGSVEAVLLVNAGATDTQPCGVLGVAYDAS